jgi:Methylamine utilisation protein MauE
VELIGLYLAACGLLVVAGVAKAVRPDGTVRALGSVSAGPLPALRGVVRLGAVAEAALGVSALLLVRPELAALVAMSYAVFAAFVAYARSTGGSVATCGCFGTPDTPATLVHLVVNAALALAAAAVAWSAPSVGMASVLAHQPADGVPLVAAGAVAAWLAYLAITVLAQLQAARALVAVGLPSRRPRRRR